MAYDADCTEVTADATVGWKFLNWTVAGAIAPDAPAFPFAVEALTVQGVKSDTTVTANFESCCDAGIGDMTIVDALGDVPKDECPFEVSPKAGC